jgi:gas vesicle protein
MNDRIYYSRDAEKRAQRDRVVLALAAAIMGAGFGALMALMFAPQTGDKTRQQLESQAKDWISQGGEVAQSAAQDLKKTIDNLRD